MSKRVSQQGGGGVGWGGISQEGSGSLLFHATCSFVGGCKHYVSLSWSHLRSLFLFSASLLGVSVHMRSHVPLPGAPCVLLFASGAFGDARVGGS